MERLEMNPEELQERIDNFAQWKVMSPRQRFDLWAWNKTDTDHFSHKWSFPMFSTSTSTIVSAISRRRDAMTVGEHD